MSFLILIIGFFFLIKGADIFVEGAASIARKFNVPAMIIGLTIVAMGTSAPEAAVSITSSLAGQNDMSVANVVGSNFFNILMVLGVSAVIAKLPVQKETIKKETPFLIIVSSMLLVFGLDLKMNRMEGLILLFVFVYFLISTVKRSKNSVTENYDCSNEVAITTDTEISEEISMPKTILICIVGIAGIVIGFILGLTIVAVGTSLPEFVTSIVAIKKGETEIAIGNVIGSNLFNILLVLGLAVFINPITISMLALIDIAFMVAITILLYLFMKKDYSLVKNQGFILIAIYLAYMTYTVIR